MPASMTRKHFEALAETLANCRLSQADQTYEQEAQWIADVQAVATVCARFNPTFDRARFLTACGVQED